MKTIPFEGELTEKQKKNLKKGLAALRSGKYNQCYEKFHSAVNNSCCVVGVFWLSRGDNEVEDFWASFEEKFGFPIIFDLISEEKSNLFYLNDVKKLTFPQIADIIEAAIINKKEIDVDFDHKTPNIFA